MPVPTKTTASVFTERWRRFLDVNEQIKQVAQGLRNTAGGPGTLYKHKVAQVSTTIVRLAQVDLAQNVQNAQTDGFATWAQSQVGEVIDLVAGYVDLQAKVSTWGTWIDANVGSLYEMSGGQQTPISLTTGEKAALVTQLDQILSEFIA